MKKEYNRNTVQIKKSTANENLPGEYFTFNKIGIFIVGYPDGRIIDCNEIIVSQLGYGRDEIIGENFSKFINSEGNSDNILEWQNISSKLVKVTGQKNERVNKVIQIIKLNNKNAGDKKLLITLKEEPPKEKLIKNNEYNPELEILRERELKYRTLIEQSFDGIALINKTGNIIIWNAKLLEMLGYNQEDILHTNLKDTFSNEVEELSNKPPNQKGSRTISFESRIIRKNGSHFPAEINIRLLEGEMIMLALRDISEKKAAEEMREKLFNKLIEAQTVMKTLSGKMIQVQEAERRNIARELHDEIGQTLTAIKIDIMNAMKFIPAADVQHQLQDTIQMVEGTLNNVRELSLKLRPSILDDLGLIPALRWFIDRQVQRTGIKAKVITKQQDIKLPQEFEIAAYRIIQEAVNNITKHSHAKNMSIEIDSQVNELHVTITDDGIGYDVVAARKNASGGVSVGVLGMQERAEQVGGWMDIISKQGKGTIIHAIFPYKQERNRNL